jgi:hypothetical protein
LEKQEDNTLRFLSLLVAGPYQIGWLLKILRIAGSHSLRLSILTHLEGGERSILCRPGKKYNLWQVRARIAGGRTQLRQEPLP